MSWEPLGDVAKRVVDGLRERHGAMVIRFPQTPEGREALRLFLPNKGDGGPYPDGTYFEDSDWDEVAEQMKDLDRFLEEKERRGEI